VEGGHRGVDLHPVAGGQQDRLADVRLGEQFPEDPGCLGGGRGQPLQQRHWGGAVGHSDDEQVHVATTSGPNAWGSDAWGSDAWGSDACRPGACVPDIWGSDSWGSDACRPGARVPGACVPDVREPRALGPERPPGSAVSADLRCSWKERICSSMARSTLRTSTPSGTESTHGAKLRMLVTPAATRRSATCCAAVAGVAITVIEM